jgi:hypothetical protein
VRPGSRTINFNCRDRIPSSCFINKIADRATQTKSPLAHLMLLVEQSRVHLSPVPEIGFNSITGGMQTHHSESAIIYGFNRAVHVRAVRKKEVGDQSPQYVI